MPNAKEEFLRKYKILQESYETVLKIKENFKKGPNREYKESYLTEKSEKIQNEKDTFNNTVDDITKTYKLTPDTQVTIDTLITDFNTLITEVLKIIDSKKVTAVSSDDEEGEEIIMAKFDIKTAVGIIPEFNGTSQNTTVEDLVDAIKLYGELLDPEGKNTLVNFVLKIKLKGAAKTKLKIIEEPKTIQDLIKEIENRFTVRESVASLSYKLNQTQQGQKSIAEFAEDIENTISKLTKLQITEQGVESAEVISKLNDSLALNAFRSNASREIKSVLLAANNKTLAEAITTALNAETPVKQSSAAIFNIGRFQRGRGPYRGTNNRRGNSYRNFQTTQKRNEYSNNYNGHRGYQGGRGFNRGRSNFYYRGKTRPNFSYKSTSDNENRQKKIHKVEKNEANLSDSPPLGEFSR